MEGEWGSLRLGIVTLRHDVSSRKLGCLRSFNDNSANASLASSFLQSALHNKIIYLKNLFLDLLMPPGILLFLFFLLRLPVNPRPGCKWV